MTTSALHVQSAGRLESLARAAFAPAPRRYSPTQLVNIASVIVIVMVGFFTWFTANWAISIDPQKVSCLPYRIYIQHKVAPTTLDRGSIYTYTSKGLMPILKDGFTMAKIAAGLPGDSVRVDTTGIYINGTFFGPLNDYVIGKAKLSRTALFKSYVIAPGKYLMLGTLPHSYDGRYWGLVDQSQLVGRATPVW